MTYFNVHWKGRPHRHLPRIRVASRRASVPSRSFTQVAPDQALRRPLSLTPLEKERKKQRFQLRFRRRRTQTSKSSSSAAWARRRISLRARQNIQAFGWDSPAAEFASKLSGLSPRHPSSVKLGGGLKPSSVSNYIATVLTTTIPSTDGAGGSNTRRAKSVHSERAKAQRRDSVNFAQNPLYWTSDKPRRATRETASVSPLETAPKESTYRSSQGIRRGGTYDPRVDPKGIQEDNTENQSSPSDTRRITVEGNALEKGRKPKNFRSSAFWEAASSTNLLPKGQGSAAPATIKSIVNSVLSDSSSRTPSQRKALQKFTKELELHLQATRSLPKQTLITSPSATTLSVNTITELKPYQTEFQSAGLAVTSEEQKGMDFGKSNKTQRMPTAHKKGKSTTVNNKPKQSSYASGSTGTTVMGFTPPHEKVYDRPRTLIERRRSSSDHTFVGFTPPHKIGNKPEKPTPRASARKSLPWLRKPEIQLEEPPTANKSSTNTIHTDDLLKNIVLPTSMTQESFSSFEMMAFPSQKETGRKHKTPDNFPVLSNCSTDVRWNDLNHSEKNTTAGEQPIKSEQREPNDRTLTHPKLDRVQYRYSDMDTQTSHLPETDPNKFEDNESVPNRAPISNVLSKTFPVTVPTCSENCPQISNNNTTAEYTMRMSRPSRVQWKGLEKAIQTDDIETTLAVESQIDETRTSVPSSSERVDLYPSELFKIHTKPTQTPLQSSRVPRSAQKSFDEEKPRPCHSLVEKRSEQNKFPAAPTREAPLPPRCTRCDCEIEHTLNTLGTQTETQPEPDCEIHFLSRDHPSHICTARSSIHCQQCFPSRETSAAISPQTMPSLISLKNSSPVRFTRSQHSPTPIHTQLEEASNRYHFPENSPVRAKALEVVMPDFTQQKPIADPVKRPTFPKIKRRPAPAPRPKHKKYVSTPSRAKALPRIPQPPIILSTIVPFEDLALTSTSLDTFPSQSVDISDKAVFRGLHVATAAACDEDVDNWIEEITGIGVRKYLAELSKFDGLGVNTLAGVARRAAKQRRREVKGWEIPREMRMRDKVKIGSGEEVVESDLRGENEDREMEFVVDDTGRAKRRREKRAPDNEDLLQAMRQRRECKKSDGVRQRAVKTGWSEGSVSSGT